MGYYTYYELKAYDPESGDPIDEALFSEVQAELANYFVECGNTIEEANDAIEELCKYGYEMKWYDYDEDMTRLSNKFPNIGFELEGKGEDGAWWVAQYWGGRSRTELAERPEPDLF